MTVVSSDVVDVVFGLEDGSLTRYSSFAQLSCA